MKGFTMHEDEEQIHNEDKPYVELDNLLKRHMRPVAYRRAMRLLHQLIKSQHPEALTK